jgi:hypothetical protein
MSLLSEIFKEGRHVSKKLCIRLLLSIVIVAIVSSNAVIPVSAAPYESYNYDYWGDPVAAPAAYLPDSIVSGDRLGVGALKDPQDIFVDAQDHIYILDSGNHRIIATDRNWKLIRVIESFDNKGKQDSFNQPSGIFVTKNEQIYVADTANKRVVILDKNGKLINIIEKPNSNIFTEAFVFTPLKVTVDQADRVFVVTKGAFEGILQFDGEGAFIGYIGTNKVTVNPADYFWKLISTKAQREKMVLFIPTEFSSMDIDNRGFVYATNIDPGSKDPIKRLNPSGKDILKRGFHPVIGDLNFQMIGPGSGPTYFIDIKIRAHGIYNALDGVRGRIFTYDEEGSLLYIVGQLGTQVGTFKTPVAVEALGDQMLVLDRGRNQINVLSPTEYGKLVNLATSLHDQGKDKEAAPVWNDILKLNGNNETAYIGLGKALLKEHDNKAAMKQFKLGMNRKYYSIAFKRYRKEFIRENLGTFITWAVILLLIYTVFRLVRRYGWRRRNANRAGFY